MIFPLPVPAVLMLQRLFLVAALVAACCSNSSWAAPSHARPVSDTAVEVPMTFYVVKGTSDSCGRGCDSWIAIEGKIDSGAAGRFKKFLLQQRDRNLPIYFSSPGGNLEQAVAMGNMLREKHAVARVGRAVVGECGFEAVDSEACIRLKQSGRELHGDLITRGALCVSACPYLMLGATTREIAPDASLGVHTAKVVVSFRYGKPTQSMLEAATERGKERSDRMLKNYFSRMGVEAGLLDLADSIKFEDMHVLTREELVHFAIDRREFVETPWTFESNTRPIVHKVVAQRRPGEMSFRMMQLWLVCSDREHFVMDFQRPAPTSSSFGTVSIVSGAKPLNFVFPPAKASGFEVWGLRMAQASVQSLLDLPQLEVTETSLAADGRRVAQTMPLSNDGLVGALERLSATCPAPKSPAPSQTISSRDRAEQ
jgi:hypothetical protein